MASTRRPPPKTIDLGAHWTEFTGKELLTRSVNSAVVDPTDARHVFVAFSGYREGDIAANVWETTDGERSWNNNSGRLPAVQDVAARKRFRPGPPALFRSLARPAFRGRRR
ncbi:hypothetical protein [Actinocrispum wychmicini]|uniref:hypothetical protein n=1 Tax=Actinocrispum wychmicini TaxID=1213861 RepID=UPI001050F716|nr:hypothetical protein [Actinocrispum wychmicini]